MVLDYCPFGDLAEIIIDRDKLSENTSRFIVAQILIAI